MLGTHALITSRNDDFAFVHKIDLSEGIESAKTQKKREIPAKKLYQSDYLDLSLVKDALYYFYDEENLAKIDCQSLEILKEN